MYENEQESEGETGQTEYSSSYELFGAEHFCDHSSEGFLLVCSVSILIGHPSKTWNILFYYENFLSR